MGGRAGPELWLGLGQGDVEALFALLPLPAKGSEVPWWSSRCRDFPQAETHVPGKSLLRECHRDQGSQCRLCLVRAWPRPSISPATKIVDTCAQTTHERHIIKSCMASAEFGLKLAYGAPRSRPLRRLDGSIDPPLVHFPRFMVVAAAATGATGTVTAFSCSEAQPHRVPKPDRSTTAADGDRCPSLSCRLCRCRAGP